SGVSFSPINIDRTAPVAAVDQHYTVDGGGNKIADYTAGDWTKAAGVKVTFKCTDGLSGVAANTLAGDTITSEGANQSVSPTGSCTDQAGNSADLSGVSFSPINIDRTAPVAAVDQHYTVDG